MARPTRAFRLQLSPSGFDLLLDCHLCLAREARILSPYGTTLSAAVAHLERLQDGCELRRIEIHSVLRLAGQQTVFFGAHRALATRAAKLARNLSLPRGATIEIGKIFLLALQRFHRASSEEMIDALSYANALTASDAMYPSNFPAA